MIDAAPGRVLRLSLLGWGLGHLALGRRSAGATLLLLEAIGVVIVAATTLLYADGTWYLLPFLAGCAFIGVWALQAVLAYRLARSRGGATPPPPRGSAAAAMAWLTLPLLAWGTCFWLVGGAAASPASVLDRYVSEWPEIESLAADGRLAASPPALAAASASALDRLAALCAAGHLAADCADTSDNLLHDVRIRIESQGPETATAVAEVVRFERMASTFLGLLPTSELVPVPAEPIIRLQLVAQGSTLGSARWMIMNAEPS